MDSVLRMYTAGCWRLAVGGWRRVWVWCVVWVMNAARRARGGGGGTAAFFFLLFFASSSVKGHRVVGPRGGGKWETQLTQKKSGVRLHTCPYLALRAAI
jgi:hypothetical protein